MTKSELTKQEKAILLFYLKGTLSDLSKALIFFIFFYALGLHKEFLCGLFFLIIFRIYSGGIHCKTFMRCLLFSFVILSSGIILGKTVIISKPLVLGVEAICTVIILLCTPVLAATRPALGKDAIKRAKIHEGIVLVSFLIYSYFNKTTPLSNIGVWILILHTMQILVAKVRR